MEIAFAKSTTRILNVNGHLWTVLIVMGSFSSASSRHRLPRYIRLRTSMCGWSKVSLRRERQSAIFRTFNCPTLFLLLFRSFSTTAEEMHCSCRRADQASHLFYCARVGQFRTFSFAFVSSANVLRDIHYVRQHRPWFEPITIIP